MATTSSPTETTDATPILERPVPHIISHAIRGPHEGWTSWFTTTDHKKIGIMYLYTVLVFFVLGGVEALLIRLQLGAAESSSPAESDGSAVEPAEATEGHGAAQQNGAANGQARTLDGLVAARP